MDILSEIEQHIGAWLVLLIVLYAIYKIGWYNGYISKIKIQCRRLHVTMPNNGTLNIVDEDKDEAKINIVRDNNGTQV